MLATLPQVIVEFLLANPDRLERLQKEIAYEKYAETWRAERAAKRAAARTVPCGTYGCTEPRNEMDVFCPSCEADYREDPDAFK